MMNQVQWEAYGRAVIDQMRSYTEPFVASIFLVHSFEQGSLHGSGSYLELLNKPYLLTNQHVARVLATHSLAHQLANDEFARRISNAFQALSAPVDAAVSRIDDPFWNSDKNQKKAISVSHLSQRHEPVYGELLFMMGFSAERSHYSQSLECIFPTGSPYLTQEAPLPEGYLPEFHFSVHYSPTRALSLDGDNRGLPAPPGFSGSLVWNTRAVECLQSSISWAPSAARVTGMVWLWDTAGACLIATRIEHIRAFLLEALHQEAAYFRWLSRGARIGEDLPDWQYAVESIPELR